MVVGCAFFAQSCPPEYLNECLILKSVSGISPNVLLSLLLPLLLLLLLFFFCFVFSSLLSSLATSSPFDKSFVVGIISIAIAIMSSLSCHRYREVQPPSISAPPPAPSFSRCLSSSWSFSCRGACPLFVSEYISWNRRLISPSFPDIFCPNGSSNIELEKLPSEGGYFSFLAKRRCTAIEFIFPRTITLRKCSNSNHPRLPNDDHVCVVTFFKKKRLSISRPRCFIYLLVDL